jgi:hypothetical protein
MIRFKPSPTATSDPSREKDGVEETYVTVRRRCFLLRRFVGRASPLRARLGRRVVEIRLVAGTLRDEHRLTFWAADALAGDGLR